MVQGIENIYGHILIPIKFLALFCADFNSFVYLVGMANSTKTFWGVSVINSRPKSCVWSRKTDHRQFTRLYLSRFLVESCPPCLRFDIQSGVRCNQRLKNPRMDMILLASAFLPEHLLVTLLSAEIWDLLVGGLEDIFYQPLTQYYSKWAPSPFLSPSPWVQINGKSLLFGTLSTVRWPSTYWLLLTWSSLNEIQLGSSPWLATWTRDSLLITFPVLKVLEPNTAKRLFGFYLWITVLWYE